MCCSSSSYKAPPTPDLTSLYNTQQGLANQWAPQNAQTAQNIYSQFAPQYLAENNSMLNSLRTMSPDQSALADQTARAGMASRGNIGGDANIGEEVMNRSDYANNLLSTKLGQMGQLSGAGAGQASGLNYFNPNAGPTGQQAGLSLYQGQTQNAQNQYQSDQANNPFNQAMGILGGIAKIAGPAMMAGI